MEKRPVHIIKDGQSVLVRVDMVKKKKDPRERKTKSGFTVFCPQDRLPAAKKAAASRKRTAAASVRNDSDDSSEDEKESSRQKKGRGAAADTSPFERTTKRVKTNHSRKKEAATTTHESSEEDEQDSDMRRAIEHSLKDHDSLPEADAAVHSSTPVLVEATSFVAAATTAAPHLTPAEMREARCKVLDALLLKRGGPKRT